MRKEAGKTKYNLYWDLSYTGIIIFFLFRIPITNMIGNEGNGFWAVSFESYSFLCLFFGHISFYVTSKMIKECLQKRHYRNGRKIFSSLLFTNLLISFLGAVFIYFASDALLQLFHIKLAGISFRLLGVYLIINTVAGVFRGYFEGCKSKMPTYISKIVEAIVFGITALIFSGLFKNYGSKVSALLFNTSYEAAFAAAGVAVGCILGSIFSVVFLLLLYRMYQISLQQLIKNDISGYVSPLKYILAEYFKNAGIIFLELVCFHLYRITNIFIYIQKNAQADSNVKYVEILGSYYGKVMVVAGIFIFVILSITGKNVARIRKNHIKNRIEYCFRYFCDDIKQIAIITLPVCMILFVFGKNILEFLFHSSSKLEINMFRIEIITIFFMVLGVYFFEILSKLDKKLFPILCLAISYAVQTMIMMFVISNQNFGSLSLVTAPLSFWILFAGLEFFVLWKEFRIKVKKNNT